MKAKKCKRIEFDKKPKLWVHKYIVVVGENLKNRYKEKYHFCLNRDEVRRIKARAPRGSFIDVYRAKHEHLSSFEVI